MYTALVVLHVLSVFGFLFAHGASAAVMFRVRHERDTARIHALLDLSAGLGGAMAVTALVLFVSGLVAGFMGGWWGRGWIWASLALFVGISVVMSGLGRPYLERVRRAIGVASVEDRRKQREASAPLPAADLGAVLASGRPRLVAVVGLGGLVVITWLMMVKPF
jgi:hypothetical protein